MRAEYRFLRTHEGVTRFAKIAVVSKPASDWGVGLDSGLKEAGGIYGDAIRRGLALAMAAQERRRGERHVIIVEELVETVVDTSMDSVECAAAMAAWKSFGMSENDARVEFREGRWRIAFVGADR